MTRAETDKMRHFQIVAIVLWTGVFAAVSCCGPKVIVVENDPDLIGPTIPPATGPPDGRPKPAATPPPRREGASAIEDWLGADVETELWDPDRFVIEGGGPVREHGMLDCDFEGECCYRNAIPPEDKLQWITAEGSPNRLRAERTFNYPASLPRGKFLAVVSPGAEDPFAEARFFSCAIGCTNLPITVRLKYWMSTEVLISVCTRDSFYPGPETPPLLNCQNLPSWLSPGPAEVVLPPLDNSQIVIMATNFLRTEGGIAVIDDISVSYVTCESQITTTWNPPTTTRFTTEATTTEYVPPPTEATTPPEPYFEDGTPAECALQCDFERADLCKYVASSDDTTSTRLIRKYLEKAKRKYLQNDLDDFGFDFDEAEDGEDVFTGFGGFGEGLPAVAVAEGGEDDFGGEGEEATDGDTDGYGEYEGYGGYGDYDYEPVDPEAFIKAKEAQDAEGPTQAVTFGPRTGRYRNRVTGINGPFRGDWYGAAYLHGGYSVVMVAETDLITDRVLRFRYWVATHKMTVSTCCDEDCQVLQTFHATRPPVEIPDEIDHNTPPPNHRRWRKGERACPKGTKAVALACLWLESGIVHTGACGFDEIELWKTDEYGLALEAAC